LCLKHLDEVFSFERAWEDIGKYVCVPLKFNLTLASDELGHWLGYDIKVLTKPLVNIGLRVIVEIPLLRLGKIVLITEGLVVLRKRHGNTRIHQIV
jgi:hypothetical protein